MGMRVTTGMSMNLYRYNLQNSTLNLNNSRNTVLSHRKFNSFGEAPAAATQAWRLRRAIVNTDIYLSNNKDTYTRFNIAWATLGQVNTELTDRDGRKADIYAASDPTASGRNALGQVLRQTAESVIQTMNSAKSGENFLFAGDDELYAPFTWGKNQWGTDTLLYRGVDVNAGGVYDPSVDPVPDRWGGIDAATGLPSKMPIKITNAVDQAWADYYTAKAEYNKAYQDAYDAAKATYQEAYDAAVKAYEEAEAENPGQTEVPNPDDPDWKADVPDPDEEGWAPDPALDVPDPDAAGLNPSTWKDPIRAEPTDDYGVPLEAYQVLNGTLTDDDGKPVAATDDQIAWAQYYVDKGNVQKLKEMSREEVAIDLGMGMLEDDNGKLVDGTYYNRSLPGINMLGFGVDEDGDPINVCMIMLRLGEIYENCNADTGSYDKDDPSGRSARAEALREEAIRLLDKLKAGQSHVTEQYVEVNAKSSFLQQNESRLDLQADYLIEQLTEIEDVDLADAITQFSWDYYCYSAALKVGTQLLSQSLIDYMN